MCYPSLATLSASVCQQHPTRSLFNRRTPLGIIILLCMMTIFLVGSLQAAGNLHRIDMYAEELPGGFFAYRMMRYEIIDSQGQSTDITNRYVTDRATIPGPTIVIDEGDEVITELMYRFNFATDSIKQEHVSLHVHGVHYDIDSDGTLKYINLYKDESATPVMSYTYRWVAAPGTAGTWAYHDHNMLSHNGAEDRGLFGALIVNPASGTERIRISGTKNELPLGAIAKDYVLYIGDDAFWGEEIDHASGQRTPLGVNPSLSARKNSFVRFHLIALGTNFHRFELPGYNWPDPGTLDNINTKVMGPLEKHVFTVKATRDSRYMDTAFSSTLLGMKGNFVITD